MLTEVRILRIQLAWCNHPLVTLGTVLSMECHVEVALRINV